MSVARPVLFCILFLLVSALGAGAQILNTLSGFEERPGWQGEAAGFFRLSGGNTEVRDYLATGAGQWEGDRQRVRAIVSFNQTRTEGIDTSEDLIAHLRHNLRLNGWFSTLAFTQWQRNPFQALRSRVLVGAGGRFDLVRNEKRRFAVGLAAMYEAETLIDAGDRETARFSAFLDFQRDVQEYLSLSIVCFVQPAMTDFEDLRASAVADLDIDLVGPLTLVLGSSYEYNSRPPATIEHYDWTVRTGIKLAL